MLRGYDNESGTPPRIYRTPGEILRDISDIKEKIEETAYMLNIRSLMVDILANDRKRNSKDLISELEDAILQAKEALYKMNQLKEEVTLLEEELKETKWQLGI